MLDTHEEHNVQQRGQKWFTASTDSGLEGETGN